MEKILIVGAGFAGAVHARLLAEAGFQIDVIDKRDHIAGNCYDYIHETGVRVHKYGPHLFHTSNQQVVDWLSQFTDWVPYEHRVVADLHDGRFVPLPINLDTVNSVFDTAYTSPEQVKSHFLNVRIHRERIISAEDHLYHEVGKQLTEIFFRPYTKKMWDLDLQQADASIVRRLEIRCDRENKYFPRDSFQALPKNGYAALFERIFDHPNISVHLSVEFSHALLDRYAFCFNSMPIDEYFGFVHGPLPYRSIKFHEHVEKTPSHKHAVINYTDDGPFTRETWFHQLPEHLVFRTGHVVKIVEEPCDYRENNFERYYPVKTADASHQRLYDLYLDEANQLPNIEFIGRCGTYMYLDMHQVINQSLISARKWLASRG